MIIKRAKNRKAYLALMLFACLLFKFAFATPVTAVEKKIGQIEVSLFVEDFYKVKIICPDHATMYIDGEGPFLAGQEVVRNIQSWQNIHVKFVPNEGYRLKDFIYNGNMDVSFSRDSITAANVKSDGEVSSWMEPTTTANPITLDVSRPCMWIFILTLSGFCLLATAKFAGSIES